MGVSMQGVSKRSVTTLETSSTYRHKKGGLVNIPLDAFLSPDIIIDGIDSKEVVEVSSTTKKI